MTDKQIKEVLKNGFYCKGCTLPYISNKLKQTLTEIKDIAEIAVNFCKGCGGEDYECH